MSVAMLYFAYGSNLSIAAMAARCPAAVPISKATLPDHRLVFRTWADVEPCPGHGVPGVLWTITSACETALDLYEDIAGVSTGASRSRWSGTAPGEWSRL